MRKVRLGRTGLMVTEVGFGGIPIMRCTREDGVAVLRRALDLRYVGQSYELTVSIASSASGCDPRRFLPAFHRAHRPRYGHADARQL